MKRKLDITQHYVLASADVFDETEKATWINTSVDLFNICFKRPAALMSALIARENITYNGMKLKDYDLENLNICDMLSEIDKKYPHLLKKPSRAYDKITKGYGLLFPQKIKSTLKDIGFTEQAIAQMTLSKVILYDAALCSALSNAGDDRAYASIQTTDLDEDLLNKARKERMTFKPLLASALKQAVEQQLQSESNNAPPSPQHQHPMSADFQLQCLQAILLTGCMLLIIAIIMCSPVAATLGLSATAATHTSLITGGLGLATVIASVGLFARTSVNETLEYTIYGSQNSLFTSLN